jgi:hypothetical protein
MTMIENTVDIFQYFGLRMKCSTELCLGPFVPEENSDESEMLDRIVPGAICV